MSDPTLFPYMLQAGEAWRPPMPPCAAPCPYVPEGERAFLLRPRSRADLLRAAATLAARAEVRCLLLALPESCGETEALRPEDLRRWAAEAEARFGRPVALLTSGAACPCGPKARCHGHADTVRREQCLRLSALGLRSQSLAEALAETFPRLTPREREMLQAWAHRPEPSRPQRPIFQRTLAQAFKGNTRWVQRVLARARAENPKLFARLGAMRAHRLRRTGAWEVRGG